MWVLKPLNQFIMQFLKPHPNFLSLDWAQMPTQLKDVVLQNKSRRLFHCLKRNAYTSNLFKSLMILKFPDKVSLENCIFFINFSINIYPETFKSWLTLTTVSHTHHTRWSKSRCLKIPSQNTKLYGRDSVNISAIHAWIFYGRYILIFD